MRCGTQSRPSSTCTTFQEDDDRYLRRHICCKQQRFIWGCCTEKHATRNTFRGVAQGVALRQKRPLRDSNQRTNSVLARARKMGERMEGEKSLNAEKARFDEEPADHESRSGMNARAKSAGVHGDFSRSRSLWAGVCSCSAD